MSPLIHPEAELSELVQILPHALQAPVRALPQADLLEFVLDLGRPPEARLVGRTVTLADAPVTEDELAAVLARLSPLADDNRAGIERTLHRVSAIRNRRGRVIGLTLRVGRAIVGTIELIKDLVQSGKNLLLLGRPGVGKTTKLREIARVLADDLDKRVMVIDTSNEIGGDGDIPHPAIGRARRMQVARPELQHAVMIEAVENHMPEAVIVDEIGTEQEALAARTIAERGVQLVATAHGNTLDNLVLNPTLSDLVGGVHQVTLSDEEARRRGTLKTVSERRAPPTFDVVVELVSRDEVVVHRDTALAVDALLAGRNVGGERRSSRPPLPSGENLAGREGTESGTARRDRTERSVEAIARAESSDLPRAPASSRELADGARRADAGWTSSPRHRGGDEDTAHGAGDRRTSIENDRAGVDISVRRDTFGARPRADHRGSAGVSERGEEDRTHPPVERSAGPERSARAEGDRASPSSDRLPSAGRAARSDHEHVASHADRFAPAERTARVHGDGDGPHAARARSWPTASAPEELRSRFAPAPGTPAEGGGTRATRVYIYGVGRQTIDRVMRTLGADIRIVSRPENAEVLFVLRSRAGDPRIRRALEREGMQSVLLKRASASELRRALRTAFVKGANAAEEEELRDALEETEAAVRRALSERVSIPLSPRAPPVRKLQHQLAERFHLQTISLGSGKDRHLVVYPEGVDELPDAPDR